MTLKFGTDGIRGVANSELTPELSLALGQAAASVLSSGCTRFLIGRDTRRSGPLLQAALAAGIASAGIDVVDLGVLPTPAVAYLSGMYGAPAAMISASHNLFADNGIKFFRPGGSKLSDDVEEALEERLAALLGGAESSGPTGAKVGTITSDLSAAEHYARHLNLAFPQSALGGLHVVLDCAHGAASGVARYVYESLGARVTLLHAEPDGSNINDDCGSTHPASMQQTVVDMQADLGLAFDGDADRVLASDHTGKLVDGDEILGMLALDAKAREALKDDTLVITVMSNLGLRLSMERAGISVHETKVGDRYVLEALGKNGWSLGGEQSGHVIFPDLATTGDGLLTGLKVCALVASSGKPLSELAHAAMTKLPQLLRNVRVRNRDALESSAEIWDEVRRVEEELGNTGRVLLRPSGTEPLVRVMVEAPTEEVVRTTVDRLCGIVERVLAGVPSNQT